MRTVCLALLLTAGVARAAPPGDLDATVQRLLTLSGAPGAAVSIVEDGRVVLARGYGVRRLGDPAPVDAHTLFGIGSTTKAMTVAALAELVDKGKLAWDDHVAERLPGFGMHDGWVAQEFMVRDMLTHRSGLGFGAGDLMMLDGAPHARQDVLGVIRHLKPATSFRTTFAYSNLMYIAAGLLLQQVSGEPWERYVTAHLFQPMGMVDTRPTHRLARESADRATPHARLGPPTRGMGAQKALDQDAEIPDFVSPAGGVMSSAADMGRWIATQLGHGQVPGGPRLWTEARAREMWTGVTPLPLDPAPDKNLPPTPDFALYALGWQVFPYHGHRIVTHSGGTFGFLTQVVLIPDRNVGFFIVQNSEDFEFNAALKYDLMDYYTGAPVTDWGARLHAYFTAQTADARAALAAPPAARLARAALPAASYAGHYRDPWYGGMTVRAEAAGLTVAMDQAPGMSARLEHVGGDTFAARWKNAGLEPAYVTFGLNATGGVKEVTLAPISPIADFSFDYADLDFTPAP